MTIKLGKRIGQTVYLHKDRLSELDTDIAKSILMASQLVSTEFHWNVMIFRYLRLKTDLLDAKT